MDHGIIHTWPIFTIRTGINTQKCVRRKIQHFTPSNLCAHWWIHYNYITIIPKVGNTMYDVYSICLTICLTICPALTRPENQTARAKHATAYSRSSHDINPVIIRHPPVPMNA
jgi:hypothetical protein